MTSGNTKGLSCGPQFETFIYLFIFSLLDSKFFFLFWFLVFSSSLCDPAIPEAGFYFLNEIYFIYVFFTSRILIHSLPILSHPSAPAPPLNKTKFKRNK